MIGGLPLVSVAMPCYNHETYVAEAIKSVLNQTYPSIELVVIDDGSTDGTVATIEATIQGSPRQVHFERQANMGLARTLNRGISLASGEWITLLASDDGYFPGHIQALMEAAAFSPEAQVVVGRAVELTGQGAYKEKGESFERLELAYQEGNLFKVMLSEGIGFNYQAMAVKKNCYDILGLYTPGIYIEDWDMSLRIARNIRSIAFVRQNGAFHRQRGAMSKALLLKAHAETRKVLISHAPPGIARRSLSTLNARSGRAFVAYGLYLHGMALMVRALLSDPLNNSVWSEFVWMGRGNVWEKIKRSRKSLASQGKESAAP